MGNRESARSPYTSTGVRPPCVTEQHTAPARANLEYKPTPESFSGVRAAVFWTKESIFADPVDDGGAEAAMLREMERGVEEEREAVRKLG